MRGTKRHATYLQAAHQGLLQAIQRCSHGQKAFITLILRPICQQPDHIDKCRHVGRRLPFILPRRTSALVRCQNDQSLQFAYRAYKRRHKQHQDVMRQLKYRDCLKHHLMIRESMWIETNDLLDIAIIPSRMKVIYCRRDVTQDRSHNFELPYVCLKLFNVFQPMVRQPLLICYYKGSHNSNYCPDRLKPRCSFGRTNSARINCAYEAYCQKRGDATGYQHKSPVPNAPSLQSALLFLGGILARTIGSSIYANPLVWIIGFRRV